MGNLGGDRLRTSINEVQAAFILNTESEMILAPSLSHVTINGASRIVGLATWLITMQYGHYYLCTLF
jgi:hypothetical protein